MINQQHSRAGLTTTGKELNPIAAIFSAIVVFSMFAFKSQPDTNKAEVNTVQGYLIFTDSRPVASYQYIGTITTNAGQFDPQYTVIRDKIISKVKKQFPQANAIVFHLNAGSADTADAIKIPE
jgi:hypothetical protein